MSEAMSEGRERVFWDEHAPDLEHCLREYNRGAAPNTAAMFEAISPLAGKRVLDFACGAGITSAWLAALGADVTGVDISPRSIQRAEELATHLGLSVTFTTSGLSELPEDSFDAVVGQYALHHVDLNVIAPLLKRLLVAGGVGAFVETMALNPVLNMSRRHLAGRATIARLGSEDERPLNAADLATLKAVFGEVSLEVGEMKFLQILDRNMLKYRSATATRALGGVDDWLRRRGLGRLSYHQVVKIRNLSGTDPRNAR